MSINYIDKNIEIGQINALHEKHFFSIILENGHDNADVEFISLLQQKLT